MTYREHSPPPALAPFVDRFWSRTAAPGAISVEPIRVLPDGCVDLIVDLDAGTARVVGTMTAPLVVPPGPLASLVAVRFAPGAAARVLGVDVAELTDRSVDVTDLPEDPVSLTAILDRRESGRDALHTLIEGLCGRVAGRASPDAEVGFVVRRLFAPDAPGVEAIANELGRSRQHVARLFRAHVGLTPKQLARIARMQRAVATLQRSPRRALADLALALGYFDQAHLARDLRLLTGLTALELRRQTGSVFPISSLLEEAGSLP